MIGWIVLAWAAFLVLAVLGHYKARTGILLASSEQLCACGHVRRMHDQDWFPVCAGDDCRCLGFRGAR